VESGLSGTIEEEPLKTPSTTADRWLQTKQDRHSGETAADKLL
jgi:hypothetical protein